MRYRIQDLPNILSLLAGLMFLGLGSAGFLCEPKPGSNLMAMTGIFSALGAILAVAGSLRTQTLFDQDTNRVYQRRLFFFLIPYRSLQRRTKELGGVYVRWEKCPWILYPTFAKWPWKQLGYYQVTLDFDDCAQWAICTSLRRKHATEVMELLAKLTGKPMG